MLAEYAARIGRSLGKGPGFILIGVLEVAVALMVAKSGKDLSGLSMCFAAINAGVFGGGAMKAMSEAKNGKSA